MRRHRLPSGGISTGRRRLAGAFAVASLLGAHALRAQGGGSELPADVESRARAMLAAFDAACTRDGSDAWGVTLCGPVLLVDRSTHALIANRRDAHRTLVARRGTWTGTLPSTTMASNTAIQWSGTRWASVVLPLPTDDFSAIALLGHESFHRLQPSLGIEGPDAVSAHLDERDGRIWLRLELHALSYALTTTGDAARQHARAAVRFREERRRLYPSAAAAEDALERVEGTAEYSGARLALAQTPMGMLGVVRAIDGVEQNPTYVRSFAYATGPALGLLLDRWVPAWQRRLARGAAMGAILRQSLGSARGDVVDLARPYGYASVVAAEDARQAERVARLARYRAAFIEGSRLVLPGDGVNRSFDPNTLVTLDSAGIVHPTANFTGPWGTLEVTGGEGALLAADYKSIIVAAPAGAVPNGSTVRGDGWVLTLADGWVVRAVGGKGERRDLEVVRR